jgi:hypothetical protein
MSTVRREFQIFMLFDMRVWGCNAMGCVFSKTDINDLHPNIFQVEWEIFLVDSW